MKTTKRLRVGSDRRTMKNITTMQLLTPVALAVGLLTHAVAQVSVPPGVGFRGESVTPSLGTLPNGFPGTSNGGIDYSANATVARLVVEVEKNDLPADGVSANRITIRALDVKGNVVANPTGGGKLFATIEVTGGRLLVDGAKTDEFGPGRRDSDRVVPGTQIELKNGVATLSLLAPIEAQDVRVRVTLGSAVAQGTVSYLPELREFVAAGLLEGIIAQRRNGNSTGSPTRIDDGFERELRRWVNTTNNGKTTYGVRSAFFVKGVLQNGWLLTAAADSDKERKGRYFNDPRSNEFYPVYGDSALRGSEAKSADRVYLRMDKGKTYGLYGDFSTGDGFSQLTGGGNVAGIKLRNLGSYNRTATGLRGHIEEAGYFGNAYYFRDNLKQVVEEYRGNGTSGPYNVALKTGIQNTEKVEIVTRDRNQLGRVLAVQTLIRFDDYTFEPFSGAILLKSPVPNLSKNHIRSRARRA
jgi:hypothetical protein